MKKLLAFILLASACIKAYSQPGTVKGVITFFFNEYQGDKPDIGSKVIVFDSAQTKEFSIHTYDSFDLANSYREIAASYERRGSSVPSGVIENAKKYGGDEAYFKDLDARNMKQLIALTYNDKAHIATVDGSGNYSISVPRGTYFIYIKSNNRKGSVTMSELSGQNYIRRIKVKPGETLDISHKFNL